MEDIDAVHLHLHLVTGGEQRDIGLAEDHKQVPLAGVLEVVRHVQIGVHPCLQDRNPPQLVELGRVRFEVERTRDQHVEVGLSNGKIVEWDIENEKIQATWKDHTGVVTGIGALKNNRPFITTSTDQTIALRSPVSGDLQRYPASDSTLHSMAVSADERWLATLDLGGDVRVWDVDRLTTGNVVATGWGLLDCVAVSHDGQHVAWGGNDGFSMSHSADWMTSRTFRRAMSGGAMIHKLQFSSSGGRLLSAGMFPGTYPTVWDTQSGLVIKQFHDRPGAIPTLLSDGRHILTSESSALVRLEVDTGREISRFQRGNVSRDESETSFIANRVLVSPDERYALTLRHPMTRWNLADGSFMSIEHEIPGSAVCGAWSEDSHRFAVGFSNGVVQIWDAERGDALGMGAGHQGLTALAFNRDGSRLVSSGDTTIRVWDPSTMNELCTLEGHTQLVRDLCFSRDGHQIISVSWDRTVRVWDGTPDRSIPRDREMASAAIRFFRSQSTDSQEVQRQVSQDRFLTERARQMALDILSQPVPPATTIDVLNQ